MLRFMRGVFVFLLLALTTITTGSVMFFLAGLEFITRTKLGVSKIPPFWAWLNSYIFRLNGVSHDVRGGENLAPDKWYMIIANHQSGVDIFTLYNVFIYKIPYVKFFLKKSLIWIPIIGLACYLIDFPFLGRYSKDYLKKHPEKKGEDVKTTLKSCEKFKLTPTTLTSFVEGTRFTKAKHANTNSPYQNLLKPKAGGVALALMVMGPYIDHFLDVTIVYPNGIPTLWDYLCGKVNRIIIDIKERPLDKNLCGNYETDPAARRYFHKWLKQVWQEKDAKITAIKNTSPLVGEVARRAGEG